MEQILEAETLEHVFLITSMVAVKADLLDGLVQASTLIVLASRLRSGYD